MSPEETYEEALRRVREAAETRSTVLNLGGLVSLERFVPLVIKMNDLLETFEYPIMHVSPHKCRVWALVRVPYTRCLKESAELRDVTRNSFVKPGPIRRRIGIRA